MSKKPYKPYRKELLYRTHEVKNIAKIVGKQEDTIQEFLDYYIYCIEEEFSHRKFIDYLCKEIKRQEGAKSVHHSNQNKPTRNQKTLEKISQKK